MIAAPRTYSDWVKVLTLLKNKQDDAGVLQAMRSGTIEWQSGVAERFSQKLVDAINARMNAATDRFQRDIGRAGGQEGVTVQAILALRKELAFLTNAVDLPAIPQEQRMAYIGLVRKQADSIQSSLEDSAKRDRSGKLSSIIRNHKVNSF